MNSRIATQILRPANALMMLVGVALAVAAGCSASSQVVPVSGPHPPTTPDQVKIYQNPPDKYEILDVVIQPISSDVHWDQNGDANAGFVAIINSCASRGANGVLLQAPPNTTQAGVLAGFHGTFYNVPMQLNPRAAVVQAIWVVKE